MVNVKGYFLAVFEDSQFHCIQGGLSLPIWRGDVQN